jgi:ethanolamine utilization protein EutQ
LTKNRVMGASADKNFTSGVYSTQIKTSEYCEASPVDEFLFVVAGSQRFTSTDGTVVEVKEGEAAFIPKGWTGRWETQGFEEFYVIYDPDKTLQSERSKK